MKIDELVGYKNKPEYKAVKDSDYIVALMKKLDDLGYKKYNLGSGLYGTVYARPEDNFVVKIFSPDKGYSKYLAYMQAHKDSPYVPKTRGKPIKLPNGFTLVRLERLTEVTRDFYAEFTFLRTPRKGDAMYDSLRRSFEERYPGFLKILNDLKIIANDDRLAIDLHQGNIMMRGETPVITDPFV